MNLITGSILIYKITEEQANEINRRRTNRISIAARIKEDKWPIGAQAHIGSVACVGEEYPMIVVRVWSNEFGPGIPGVNGQLFLDGNDCLWLTSVGEGKENGQWHWPEKIS